MEEGGGGGGGGGLIIKQLYTKSVGLYLYTTGCQPRLPLSHAFHRAEWICYLLSRLV